MKHDHLTHWQEKARKERREEEIYFLLVVGVVAFGVTAAIICAVLFR